MIDEGRFAYTHLNVAGQLKDPESLLSRARQLLRARADLKEVGDGKAQLLTVDHPAVFAIAHACEATSIMLANLGKDAVTVRLREMDLEGFEEVLSDSPYPATKQSGLTLHGYGYRWFRRVGSEQ